MRIVRQVVSTASSTVYELVDGRGRRFALKVVAGEDSREAVRRFEAELGALRSIRSDHVVRVVDGFARPGPVYALLAPWLVGPTLREVLDRGPLAPARARRVVLDVLAGLSAIHAAGLLHRDVCAENVVLGREADEPLARERAILVDLGLALAQGLGATPGYVRLHPSGVAPEQLLGGRLDARTDVYAVGGLLHELLTGAPAFEVPGASADLAAHLERLPRLPSAHSPSLAPFDGVVDTALARRPDRRYRDAAEMARALAAVNLDGDALGAATQVERRP